MMNGALAASHSLFFLREQRRFVLAKESLSEVAVFADLPKSVDMCKPYIIFWRKETELVASRLTISLGAGASLSARTLRLPRAQSKST